ncbi:MAG: hypothetical protein IPM35_02540 [Myxococcales bacterium]|nr:hypothetical protein [Myxococcales bacterium]
MALHRQTLTIDAHTRRRLCVAAYACPATIDRYISGRDVRTTSRARIVQALREIGRDDLIRPEDRMAG